MNRTNMPLVTVVTLVYNTNKYAIEALESIRRQSYTKIEHIIIDDSSTDDSADQVEMWINSNKWNCIFIRNSENKGIPHNMNKALKIAKGKYFCCISDDLWSNNHIEIYVDTFEPLPDEIAVLYSDYSTINEKSELLKGSHSETINSVNHLNCEAQFKTLLKGNIICAATTFMKTMALISVDGYDESRKAEDIQMWLKLTKNNYKLHFIPVNTTSYRIRSNSLTALSVGKGSEEPLNFYLQYLGINKEYDTILAPRFYYWTKRLVKFNKDYRLKWPLKTFMLNKDLKSSTLLVYCLIRNLISNVSHR